MIDSLGVFNYNKYIEQKAELKFRDSSRYKQLNCKSIVDELNEVYSITNSIEAQDVVDYARVHTNSEFHKGLEWNDDKAANEYRKNQVHQIISDIIIVQTTDNAEPIFTNDNSRSYVIQAYSHIDSVSGYLPTISIMQTTDTRDELIQKALRELNYWKEKYKNLVEFDNIVNAIDNLNI